MNISQLVALTGWRSERDGRTERKMQIANRVQRIAAAEKYPTGEGGVRSGTQR